MKNEEFEELLKQKNIKKNAWIPLDEIKSIIMKNGSYIYPDWEHCRYYITDKEIFIKCGISVPYGAMLGSTLRFSLVPGRTPKTSGPIWSRNINWPIRANFSISLASEGK